MARRFAQNKKQRFVALRTEKIEGNSRSKRTQALFFLIFVFAAFIVARLFNFQVLKGDYYSALASEKHEIYQQLFPKRGEIFMQDRGGGKKGAEPKLYPLATNIEYNLVFADPKNVADPAKAAKELGPILGIDQNILLAKLSKANDSYEPLKHKVTEKEAVAIKALNLAGINFQKETYRYYPEKSVASQLAGFLGFKGDKQVGQYGLEGYFDEELRGEEGHLKSETDPAGRLISFGDTEITKAKDGDDLVLTIDRTIETLACSKIKEAVDKYGADSGTVIIMDPKTGAIIAMCNYPDFDPNEYSKVKDISVFNNLAVWSAFEPGSVFKPLTMAAAIDTDKVLPDSTYIDEGFVKYGQFTIKNSDGKANGVQTMTQVLEKSLNTGAIYVEEKLGNSLFRQYVRNFGFGQATGIELGMEASGNISSLDKKGDIYSATASYGQGITATPLQVVSAFAAIANGGNLMKPYLVDEISKSDGVKIKTEPKIVRRVISERTATLIGGMLVSVVQNGHGKRAGVPGYYVAGKTGTAQVHKSNGPGYEENITIGSFVGFAPVEDPRFAMIVKIDHPRDVQWAESSAAPIFGEIAKFLLNYYQVPTNR